MENGEKEWMKWFTRTIIVLVWGAIITVLTAYNSRLCATETKQADTQTEIASIKKDIEYIKKSGDEQKQDLKEIAALIRSIK